jgi:hypothetical protein
MGTIFEMDIPNGFKRTFLDPKQGEGESPIYALDYPNGFVNYPNIENAFLPNAARGDIAMRGVSGWEPLPPGPLGQVLTSQGPGADLIYSATAVAKELAPTYVVGSADAGDSISNCDFLHQNGVTDGLLAAITAANATGGVVYLRRGLYQTPAQLTLSGIVDIVGEGQSSIIEFTGERTVNAFVISANECSLRNLKIILPDSDGGGTAFAALEINGDDFELSYVTVSLGVATSWNEGLIWVKGNECTFDHLRVNPIFNLAIYAIKVGDAGVATPENCKIIESDIRTSYNLGPILVETATDILISDSTLINITVPGRSLHLQADDAIDGVLIQGCRMFGAVVCYSATTFKTIKIDACKIVSEDDGAVIFFNGGADFEDVLVSNNTLQSDGGAAAVYQVVRLERVLDSTVHNNKIYMPEATTSKAGIQVLATSGAARILNNKIISRTTGNSHIGIYVLNDFTKVLGNYLLMLEDNLAIWSEGTHHTLNDNTIVNLAIGASQRGIYVINAAFIDISDNDMLINGGVAIQVADPATKVSMGDNVLQIGAPVTGILTGAAVTGTCTGNSIDPTGVPLNLGAGVINANNHIV